MSASTGSQRSPWIVPIIVAIVGAIGVIGAAVIPGLINPPDDSARSGTTVASTGPPSAVPSSAPDIAGDYYLDPGNTRVIQVRKVGTDTYRVSEQLPADWPFEGEVSWDGELFRGPGMFSSGVTMEISMVPLEGGRLKTAFDFSDSPRVDNHTLVPVD